VIGIGTTWLPAFNVRFATTCDTRTNARVASRGSGRTTRKALNMRRFGIMVIKYLPVGKSDGDSVFSAIDDSWVIILMSMVKVR